MAIDETTQKAIALALVSGVLLIAWLTRRFDSALDQKRRKRRAKRAQRGEARGRVLLERAGYSVVGEQVRSTTNYFVDGERHSAVVVADFIAKKWGRRYVAEVKTGKESGADSPATRRQLLEYQRVFNVDSLLLVNGRSQSIREIRFESRHSTRLWLIPALVILFMLLRFFV